MSDFDKGARAMFDYFLIRACNNFHGNPKIDAECQKENELIRELAEDALEEVSPDSCTTWHEINKLQDEITRLKKQKGVF